MCTHFLNPTALQFYCLGVYADDCALLRDLKMTNWEFGVVWGGDAGAGVLKKHGDEWYAAPIVTYRLQ